MKNKTKSYYKHIVIIFLSFSIISSLIIIAVFLFFISSSYHDFNSEIASSLSEEVMSISDDYFDGLEDQIMSLYDYPDYLSSLNSDSTTNGHFARDLVTGTSFYAAARNVTIYDNSNTLKSGFRIKKVENFDVMNDGSTEAETVLDYLHNEEEAHQIFIFSDSKGNPYIRFVERLYQNMGRDVVGYVVFDINPDYLIQITEDTPHSDSQHIWLTSTYGGSCFVSKNINSEAESFMESQNNDGNGAQHLSTFRTDFIETEPSDYGYSVCVYSDSSWISHITAELLRLLSISLCIECAVMIGITLIMNQRVSIRISSIIKILHKISEGESKLRLPSQENDEIGLICRDFNYTLDALDTAKKAELEGRRALEIAKYDSLQTQVNPHFLFNTLETMGGIALSQKCEVVNNMCDALARMMRYSLQTEYTNKEATLGEELEHVRNYMYIINVRTFNTISFIDDIPQNLYSVKIPRVTLQPLVDNAVRHGLRNNHGDKILHMYASKSDKVYISIADSGEDNDADLIEKIIHKEIMKNDGHASIGLQNIEERVILLYGKEYGLSARRENCMTVVTLSLPLVSS